MSIEGVQGLGLSRLPTPVPTKRYVKACGLILANMGALVTSLGL